VYAFVIVYAFHVQMRSTSKYIEHNFCHSAIRIKTWSSGSTWEVNPIHQ
jgi:hypothetical protein